MPGLLVTGCLVLSVMLTLQSAFTLYIMLYVWDQPDGQEGGQAPSEFLPPRLSFTVMLPCRHEEEVIQGTIEKVARSNYPSNLLEIVVICSADDTGTIEEAQKKIDQLAAQGIANARVIVFDDKPINKPHGLNVGLRGTSHEVVTIFDAEDDIHPDIFQIVNTVMQTRGIRVIQCGVQLMNFDTNWYSTLNVLEYFFWFKSRLHYHARCGTIPLGGNTVFFARPVLEGANGWDEQNLTEDADIGMRISCKGERVCVVYDDRYVTREETPPSIGHFIKQRTRWSQGFLQTLKKGDWLRLPSLGQRLLALYTLSFPCAQAVLGFYVLVSVAMVFWFKTEPMIAIVLTLPLYMLVAHFLMAVIGLYEFTEAHGLKPSWRIPVVMAISYLPYQWLLSYAALRATVRELKGVNNWEKTKHVGAHRQDAGSLAEHPIRTEA